MKNLSVLDWVAFVLVAIGGINWGIIGLANINIVGDIFGAGFIGRLIYILVGLSALYFVYRVFVKKD